MSWHWMSSLAGFACPRLLFLSSFVPRGCGLATFTEDLLQAAALQGATCRVIAMNRPGDTHPYDERVIATVQEDRLDEYLAVAERINAGGFDVLSIQHEYGIFGGPECDHLLRFLETVSLPIVTTLHTVLQSPSEVMRRQLMAMAARSCAVMVMNALAVDILADVYGVNPDKVAVIHHGAPVTRAMNTRKRKAELGIAQHPLISTFGLISAGKGLEYAIQAMPAIIACHPEVRYCILGQTHPVVKQQEGERYRESLQALARELGVEEQVVFVDKYLGKGELIAYLQASDIYLTPYLNMEQVTSGTLAYAMACGRPLVSTPYLHAQYLLDEGRGILVPPADPAAIADACLRILDDPVLQITMETANRHYGRQMHWPQVGREFVRLCLQCLAPQETVVRSV